MQEEIAKLKNEAKKDKQKLRLEVECRKTWQDMSKKKDEELNMYK